MRKKNEHKLNLRIKQIEDNFMAAGEEARAIMGQRRTKSMPNRKLKPLHFLMKEELLEKILHVIESQPNTDILYGRDFDDEVTAIEQIESPIGEVVINGMIRSIETREIRNERTIII